VTFFPPAGLPPKEEERNCSRRADIPYMVSVPLFARAWPSGVYGSRARARARGEHARLVTYLMLRLRRLLSPTTASAHSGFADNRARSARAD